MVRTVLCAARRRIARLRVRFFSFFLWPLSECWVVFKLAGDCVVKAGLFCAERLGVAERRTGDCLRRASRGAEHLAGICAERLGVAECCTGDCLRRASRGADHFAGICAGRLGVAERRTGDCAEHFAGICAGRLGVAERRTEDCADHFAGAWFARFLLLTPLVAKRRL